MTRLINADELLAQVAQLRKHTIRSETQDALEAIRIWVEAHHLTGEPGHAAIHPDRGPACKRDHCAHVYEAECNRPGTGCQHGPIPTEDSSRALYPGQPGTRTVAFSAAALLVHVVLPGRHPILLASDTAPTLDQLTERDAGLAVALLDAARREITER